MAKVCSCCRRRLCGRCGQCHAGASCLWSAPSCSPVPRRVPEMEGEAAAVLRVLVRKVERMHGLAAQEPHTAQEVRECHIRADTLMISAFEDVVFLLPEPVQEVVGWLAESHAQVWLLSLVSEKEGRS